MMEFKEEIKPKLELHYPPLCKYVSDELHKLERVHLDFNRAVYEYHAKCFGWIDYFEQKPHEGTWIFTKDIYGKVRLQYYISNSSQEDMIDLNSPMIVNSQLYKDISRFRYWMNSPVFTKPELPIKDSLVYKETIDAMNSDK